MLEPHFTVAPLFIVLHRPAAAREPLRGEECRSWLSVEGGHRLSPLVLSADPSPSHRLEEEADPMPSVDGGSRLIVFSPVEGGPARSYPPTGLPPVVLSRHRPSSTTPTPL
jgi:hypothetical protein